MTGILHTTLHVGDIGHAGDRRLVLVLQYQRARRGGVIDGLATDADAAVGYRALILRRSHLGCRGGLVAALVRRVASERGDGAGQRQEQACQYQAAFHGIRLFNVGTVRPTWRRTRT